MDYYSSIKKRFVICHNLDELEGVVLSAMEVRMKKCWRVSLLCGVQRNKGTDKTEPITNRNLAAELRLFGGGGWQSVAMAQGNGVGLWVPGDGCGVVTCTHEGVFYAPES